jgi:hypothetical protein
MLVVCDMEKSQEMTINQIGQTFYEPVLGFVKASDWCSGDTRYTTLGLCGIILCFFAILFAKEVD